MSDKDPVPSQNNDSKLLENPETLEAARAQYGRIQKLIEGKAWAELAEMVTTDVIIFDGYPKSKLAVFEEINRMTEDFTNIQFLLKDLEKVQITDNTGRLSGVAQLIWDVADSWEEQWTDLELHLGISKSEDGRWYATHVGLRILPKPKPVAAAPDPAAQANYFAAAQANYFAAAQANYFAAAAPYFSAQATSPSFAFPTAASSSARRHIVYMPVILDHETLTSLFGDQA